MIIKNNIVKDVTDFHLIAENSTAIDEKLNELLELLSISDINSETAKIYQEKFDAAIKRSLKYHEQAEIFKNLTITNSSSREKMLDEFSILLSNNQFDSRNAKKYIQDERLSKFVLMVISVVMITLGLAMIIMPAPPFFEMFTIFYFTANDGVTLMDLISLLIMLAGIFFLIKAIYRNPTKVR